MEYDNNHGGGVYRFASSMGVDPRHVFDFSASINPIGPPESVSSFLSSCLFEVKNYPDTPADSLEGRIAAEYGVPASKSVMLGNGSAEFLYLLPQALGLKTILTVSPSFSEYGCLASRLDITEHKLVLDEPFELVQSAVKKRLEETGPVDMVYLCNPNNPTGHTLTPSGIERLLECLQGGLLLVDEAFMGFCPEYSVITSRHPSLIVLGSFTKFYSIPGLRLGFLSAETEIVNLLRKWQPPWSVNALALKAGELCLDDAGFAKETIEYIKTEADFLSDRIKSVNGLYPYKGFANFILVRLDEVMRCEELQKNLEESLVLIRNCKSFGLKNHFRVAVKKREENLFLLEKLQEVCGLVFSGGGCLLR